MGFLSHVLFDDTQNLALHFQSMLFGDDKYWTKKLNVIGHVTTCIVLGTWKNILQSSEQNYILILFLSSPIKHLQPSYYATLISWANSQPSPVWGLRCCCCCCCIVVVVDDDDDDDEDDDDGDHNDLYCCLIF